MHRPLIILDRDGVINEDSDDYIKSLEEWRPLPGSIEAIARLHHAGYRVAVATNQSGLARGLLTPNALNAIHERLHRLLEARGARVELIAYCPHGPEDHCRCRKPNPGLFEAIAQRLGVALDGAPCIGDSLRDAIAAWSAGASPWLVRSGKGERALAAIPDHPQRSWLARIPVHADLSAATDALLASHSLS